MGPSELRVGWRLLIFVVIVGGLMVVRAAVIRTLPHFNDGAFTYLADKISKFTVFLLATWIMARIEGRTISDYGLPWRKAFGRQFWQGSLGAFLGLAGFLATLRLAGLFHFGRMTLHGGGIWKWGALYALGFIVVALEEEFHYRSYGLYTLTQATGFWPAAALSSAIFGYSHLGSPGENWLGVFNAGAGGLLFCLLLRRSGNLWMPIGLHASWDWTQSYFYGIPDSGHTLPGHLLSGNFLGPTWLTGGTVGPEGSLLLTLLLVAFWLGASAFLPEVHYPTSPQLGRLGVDLSAHTSDGRTLRSNT
jgi:membrane protease YdiL (CAAX protease family)